MPGAGAAYPAEREAEVVLRDGSTVHVRPVRAEDEEAIHEFLESLHPESRMFRFFSVATDLRAVARSMVDVDYSRRYGLVAIRDQTVVGQGLYFGDGPDDAEVAFAVADRLQGKGLGTLLLAHLAEVACENGISVFWAEVMPQNHRMLEVFRESGFPVEMSSEPGAIRVELPTSFADEAVGRFENRDRLAAIAAASLLPRAGGGRRHRGLPRAATPSAASSSTTHSSPASRASSIRSTRARTWSRP